MTAQVSRLALSILKGLRPGSGGADSLKSGIRLLVFGETFAFGGWDFMKGHILRIRFFNVSEFSPAGSASL